MAHQAFADCKVVRSGVGRALVVVFIDDGVDHDCLLVDRYSGVRGNCDPVVYAPTKLGPFTYWANVEG